MRSRLFAVFSALMVFGLLSFVHAAEKKPEVKPTPHVKGAHAIANLLDSKVTFRAMDDPTITLEELLQLLAKEHKFNVRIYEEAFRRANVEDVRNVAILNRPLSAMANVRLSDVIRRILDRIPGHTGATYVIRRDGIEITTMAYAKAEIWGGDQVGPFLPLVHLEVKEQPLSEVLPLLAAQTDRNVLLDPRVKEQASKKVSFSVINTPLDTALLFLCNVTEIDFVLRDNVVFVTTKENAAVLRGRLKRESRYESMSVIPVRPGPGEFAKQRSGLRIGGSAEHTPIPAAPFVGLLGRNAGEQPPRVSNTGQRGIGGGTSLTARAAIRMR